MRCEGCDKDAEGRVTCVHCTVDMDSLSGTEGANRKIKGKVLHWVNAEDCVEIEARLYEPLLSSDEELEAAAAETDTADTDADEAAESLPASALKKDFISKLNPNSLTVLRGVAEPMVKDSEVGTTYQFLRTGYFCKDPDSTPELPVFNRTVELKAAFVAGKK